ncbi:MAG: hypothetical protein ACE5HF_04175 [Gemmatimonadota bacterium]
MVPGFDGDASVRFDEPLVDPRSVRRLFFGSPVDRYDIKLGRRRIRVRPEGGWRDGVVYYLRIAPGLSDLMRNPTAAPIELLFSTGPEVPATEARGHVYDRVRGMAALNASVRFLPPDTVPYGAVTDTAGAYRLPGLPPGTYRVFAFVDRNQNRRLDRAFEPYDSATLELSGPEAVAGPDLWLVEPDTTPPVLVGAEMPDSAVILLEFDEPLDPEQPADSVQASVTGEDRSGRAVARLRVGRGEEEAEPGAPRALPGRRPPASERPLPSAYLRIDLVEPTPPGSLRVEVGSVRNLRQLVGRADTTVGWFPPDTVSAPDTLPADSLRAPGEAEPDSILGPEAPGPDSVPPAPPTRPAAPEPEGTVG